MFPKLTLNYVQYHWICMPSTIIALYYRTVPPHPTLDQGSLSFSSFASFGFWLMFKERYQSNMTESLSFKHLIVWFYTQVPIPSYIHCVFTVRKRWTFFSTNIGICPNTICKIANLSKNNCLDFTDG